jgi:hypothetical protein
MTGLPHTHEVHIRNARLSKKCAASKSGNIATATPCRGSVTAP